MQLVAHGAQDAYLTKDPQITYFKVVYRRHSNFAKEAVEQTLLGTVGFGTKFSVTISRTGDLIGRVMLEVDVPALKIETSDGSEIGSAGYVNYLGHKLISEVSVEIGGQKIDSRNTNFNWALDELSEDTGVNSGYLEMVGGKWHETFDTEGSDFNSGGRLYIPLKFWFTDNVGLALPLIALQYHDVKLNVSMNSLENVTHMGGNDAASVSTDGNVSCQMFVDYYYLDTNERRRFAQMSHEYLIHQVQTSSGDSFSGCEKEVRLNFNHPVKYLMWLVQEDCPKSFQNWYKFAKVDSANIKLNNQDRFAKRHGRVFTHVVPWAHFGKIPDGQSTKNINCYSFALNPNKHNPSGSCNFSRIDNASLHVTMSQTASDAGFDAYVIWVYAVNYNVLRIMQGMGGIAYSN